MRWPQWRVLERLTIYLPTILMGLMALGTYWLVKSTPSFVAPAAEEAPRHDPDFELEKFSIKTFDKSGQMRNEVFGDKAWHFPDLDTVEIQQVRIRNFNEHGRLTTVTADKALKNSDASQVQLIGNARVVREAYTDATGTPVPAMSYRSERLQAFLDEERFISSRSVELVRGQDRFTADGMAYSNAEQTLSLQGRVRGTFMPKQESPRGK